MAIEYFKNGDNLWMLVRKILQNITYTLDQIVAGLPIVVKPIPIATNEWTTFADVTVTTPGTAQQFADIACPNGVRLSAASDNVGDFYVGDQFMNSTGSRHGTIITAAGVLEIKTISNLNQVWFDAENNTDVLYVQRL